MPHQLRGAPPGDFTRRLKRTERQLRETLREAAIHSHAAQVRTLGLDEAADGYWEHPAVIRYLAVRGCFKQAADNVVMFTGEQLDGIEIPADESAMPSDQEIDAYVDRVSDQITGRDRSVAVERNAKRYHDDWTAARRRDARDCPEIGNTYGPALVRRAERQARDLDHGLYTMMAPRANETAIAVAAPRRTQTSSGRPRAQSSRSSAKSGDSGDDSDPSGEPPAAPPAAREAVAVVWEQILRRRAPGIAWEVVR